MDNKLNFVEFTKTICELIKVFSQLILFSTSKQQTPKWCTACKYIKINSQNDNPQIKDAKIEMKC